MKSLQYTLIKDSLWYCKKTQILLITNLVKTALFSARRFSAYSFKSVVTKVGAVTTG